MRRGVLGIAPSLLDTQRADIDGLKEAAKACEGCELYAPATQVVFSAGPPTATMVLVGDNVVLSDATGRVQGRALTFHVGDERVLVDGREEIRTQMIIKQEPPKN